MEAVQVIKQLRKADSARHMAEQDGTSCTTGQGVVSNFLRAPDALERLADGFSGREPEECQAINRNWTQTSRRLACNHAGFKKRTALFSLPNLDASYLFIPTWQACKFMVEWLTLDCFLGSKSTAARQAGPHQDLQASALQQTGIPSGRSQPFIGSCPTWSAARASASGAMPAILPCQSG